MKKPPVSDDIMDDPRLEITGEDLELARNAFLAVAADPREPLRYREWYSAAADKVDRIRRALES